MALIVITGAVLAILAVGLAAECVMRRWSRQVYAHMVLDELVDRAPTYLVDDPDPTCWMCGPNEFDTYDGQCCWRCELRIAAYADTPVEYWPTQGEAS